MTSSREQHTQTLMKTLKGQPGEKFVQLLLKTSNMPCLL